MMFYSILKSEIWARVLKQTKKSEICKQDFHSAWSGVLLIFRPSLLKVGSSDVVSCFPHVFLARPVFAKQRLSGRSPGHQPLGGVEQALTVGLLCAGAVLDSHGWKGGLQSVHWLQVLTLEPHTLHSGLQNRKSFEVPAKAGVWAEDHWPALCADTDGSNSAFQHSFP